MAAPLLSGCGAGTMKGKHPVQAVRRRIESHPLGARYLADVRFRTDVNLYRSIVINALYIVLKLFLGIYYNAYWFVALAVYYVLLVAMRLALVARRGKEALTVRQEWRRYRVCGIVLLVMNQALMGIVIYMVRDARGFRYPGYLIYAMAAYSFYAVILSIVQMVKFRHHGSPLLSAAKAINFVAALVSILALETAMLAEFGGDDEAFRVIMTSATGGGVCVVVIGMAIYMIIRSGKSLKQGEQEHG